MIQVVMAHIQLQHYAGSTRKKSLFSAYIAVDKGTNIGTESLYAQQTMIQEKKFLKHKQNLLASFVLGLMLFNV
jgi:hypothetical protein